MSTKYHHTSCSVVRFGTPAGFASGIMDSESGNEDDDRVMLEEETCTITQTLLATSCGPPPTMQEFTFSTLNGNEHTNIILKILLQPASYFRLSKEEKLCPDYALALMIKRPEAYTRLKEELRNNQNVAWEAMKRCPRMFALLPMELKQNHMFALFYLLFGSNNFHSSDFLPEEVCTPRLFINAYDKSIEYARGKTSIDYITSEDRMESARYAIANAVITDDLWCQKGLTIEESIEESNFMVLLFFPLLDTTKMKSVYVNLLPLWLKSNDKVLNCICKHMDPDSDYWESGHGIPGALFEDKEKMKIMIASNSMMFMKSSIDLKKDRELAIMAAFGRGFTRNTWGADVDDSRAFKLAHPSILDVGFFEHLESLGRNLVMDGWNSWDIRRRLGFAVPIEYQVTPRLNFMRRIARSIPTFAWASTKVAQFFIDGLTTTHAKALFRKVAPFDDAPEEPWEWKELPGILSHVATPYDFEIATNIGLSIWNTPTSAMKMIIYDIEYLRHVTQEVRSDVDFMKKVAIHAVQLLNKSSIDFFLLKLGLSIKNDATLFLEAVLKPLSKWRSGLRPGIFDAFEDLFDNQDLAIALLSLAYTTSNSYGRGENDVVMLDDYIAFPAVKEHLQNEDFVKKLLHHMRCPRPSAGNKANFIMKLINASVFGSSHNMSTQFAKSLIPLFGKACTEDESDEDFVPDVPLKFISLLNEADVANVLVAGLEELSDLYTTTKDAIRDISKLDLADKPNASFAQNYVLQFAPYATSNKICFEQPELGPDAQHNPSESIIAKRLVPFVVANDSILVKHLAKEFVLRNPQLVELGLQCRNNLGYVKHIIFRTFATDENKANVTYMLNALDPMGTGYSSKDGIEIARLAADTVKHDKKFVRKCICLFGQAVRLSNGASAEPEDTLKWTIEKKLLIVAHKNHHARYGSQTRTVLNFLRSFACDLTSQDLSDKEKDNQSALKIPRFKQLKSYEPVITEPLKKATFAEQTTTAGMLSTWMDALAEVTRGHDVCSSALRHSDDLIVKTATNIIHFVERATGTANVMDDLTLMDDDEGDNDDTLLEKKQEEYIAINLRMRKRNSNAPNAAQKKQKLLEQASRLAASSSSSGAGPSTLAMLPSDDEEESDLLGS